MTDFPKNATEIVRVERTTYKGKEYVSARIWYLGEDSPTEYLPSKKGLTLLPTLAREVAQAMLEVADKVEPPDEVEPES